MSTVNESHTGTDDHRQRHGGLYYGVFRAHLVIEGERIATLSNEDPVIASVDGLMDAVAASARE